MEMEGLVGIPAYLSLKIEVSAPLSLRSFAAGYLRELHADQFQRTNRIECEGTKVRCDIGGTTQP